MEGDNFTIIWWVLPHIYMNQPWVHMCSPILNPPPASLPTLYPGFSQSSGFEYPASCIKLALVMYFNMIIYMFQCYSLKSSHPRLLSKSPKACSLTSVSLLLSCIYSHHYSLSKFHIYVLICCIGVTLSDLLHSV